MLGRFNTNYRMYGDKVSLAGTAIGQQVTIVNPNKPIVNSIVNIAYVKQAHGLNTLIQQIPTNFNNLLVSSGTPGQQPGLDDPQDIPAAGQRGIGGTHASVFKWMGGI